MKKEEDKLKLAGIRMVSEESKVEEKVEAPAEEQQISSLAEHFPDAIEEQKQQQIVQEEEKKSEKQEEKKQEQILSYVPKPFKQEEMNMTHLEIANLVQHETKLREKANFFVCPICAMVVNDP